MNYVNNRTNPCYHCNNNIDTHAIQIISSDTSTEQLAKNLQQKLDEVYATALTKGYTLPQGSVMVGAIIATIGSTVVKAAALSGANANAILNIIKGGLGKDVVLLGDNVPLANYTSLLKESIRNKVTNISQSLAGAGNPQLVIAPPTYPVGSCAAQKLLNYVVSQTDPTNKKRITKINMAEIFWKTSGKSNWSTGQLVESCNTCNWVLPMMLCNYNNDGEKVPYK